MELVIQPSKVCQHRRQAVPHLEWGGAVGQQALNSITLLYPLCHADKE